MISSEVVTWCGGGEGVECDVRTPLAQAGAWLFTLSESFDLQVAKSDTSIEYVYEKNITGRVDRISYILLIW